MRGGFIWDDDDHVTANANLRSLDGLQRIWLEPRSSPQYYPLTHTSFWIEHQLWGLNSTGYHLVNILLHSASAILLWRVLVLLEIRGALLVACLFAIHPVQVETVAWITERKNVLGGVFYFASALCFLRSSGETPKPRLRLYAFSIVFFTMAMLSKTVACSLPAALVLVLWWKRGRVTTRDWMMLTPMFLIGVALAATTAWLEVEHVQALGREWDYSAAQRIVIAGWAIWFYLTNLLVPLNLSFIYPKWPIDVAAWWQWAFPLGVIVALLVLWRMRDRWGRGPLVAALFFVGTLVPALGFFNVYPMRYSFAADHFQYIACIGVFLLIAAGVERLFKRPVGRYAVLAPLLILTMFRSSVFRSSETLWRDTLAKNPDSWMVHLNLAKTLADDPDEEDEAAAHFERQAQLAPELPETHWNLAVNLSRRGLLDAAIIEYTRALEIDPRFPQAYRGRALVYIEQNRRDEARIDLERAIRLKPDFAAAHRALARLLAVENRDAAVRHYLAAIEFEPDVPEPYIDLAALLTAAGKLDEARAYFNRGVQINPALEGFRARVLRE